MVSDRETRRANGGPRWQSGASVSIYSLWKLFLFRDPLCEITALRILPDFKKKSFFDFRKLLGFENWKRQGQMTQQY